MIKRLMIFLKTICLKYTIIFLFYINGSYYLIHNFKVFFINLDKMTNKHYIDTIFKGHTQVPSHGPAP